MIRPLLLLGLLASVSACGDGEPLFDDETPPPDNGELPPGTENPTAESSIERHEEDDDQGGGFVQNVRYNAANDTFFVDNLAFDGDNVYSRDDAVPRLAGYRVFAGDETARDPSDGDEVEQFQYRAIYGRSRNETGDGRPVTEFAIVRTGSYLDFGFGGFVYERSGGVDLPTSGQATYAGDYAGIRVFDGRAGLEYTTGEARISIDFRDFNEGEGVQGQITDRRAFDVNGNEIQSGGEDGLPLPDLIFDVGPGTITEAGEMSNGIRSTLAGEDGAIEEYEAGTYYAIVAGDNADEIVGIVVVESEDPRFEGVTAQETGGFIVYR